MSRENVDIVRRAYTEFFEHGELPLPLCDPNIRIDNVAESPLPGPYFGHAGLRRWQADIADVMPGFRVKLEELIDVGDDRVVGVVHWALGGESERLRPIQTWAVVHSVRNGLIVRAVGYLRKADALEAVGLVRD